MRAEFDLVKNFSCGAINFAKEKLINLWMKRETQNTHTEEAQSNRERLHATTVDAQMMSMQWSFLVLGACFTAISATLQALQTKGPLPMSSQLLYLALVICSTAVLVSTYIRPNHHWASLVAVHVGVFFGATALILALVINLEVPVMVISIATYLIGVLIIIFDKIPALKS